MKTFFGAYSARPLNRDDIGTVASWLDEPAMQLAIEDEATDPRHRRRLLRELASSTAMRDGRCGYLVERRATAVGFIQLMWINWISRTGEIDFLVAPGAQRTLAGFAVIQKAGEIAFEQLNLNKVYGYVYASNASSLGPLTRLLRTEATLTKAAVRAGRPTDVLLVSITAMQYQLRKQEIGWPEHER